MSRIRSRLAARVLSVVALSAGLLIPLGTGDAQAMTCASAFPEWSSSGGKTYTTSSAFLMCDPSKTSIQVLFTTSGDLLYRNGSTTVWHTNTAGAGHSLRLQANGAVSVYGCSGTSCTQGDHLLWSSYTQVSGSGWRFTLNFAVKPGTSSLFFIEDEIASNSSDYRHYLSSSGTPAP